MQRGTIKRLLDSYGFIIPNEGEDDLFFHLNNVVGLTDGFYALRENDIVEFEVEQGPKGPLAVKVHPIM